MFKLYRTSQCQKMTEDAIILLYFIKHVSTYGVDTEHASALVPIVPRPSASMALTM